MEENNFVKVLIPTYFPSVGVMNLHHNSQYTMSAYYYQTRIDRNFLKCLDKYLHEINFEVYAYLCHKNAENNF